MQVAERIRRKDQKTGSSWGKDHSLGLASPGPVSYTHLAAVNRSVVGSSPTGGVFLFPVNVKFMGFFYA